MADMQQVKRAVGEHDRLPGGAGLGAGGSEGREAEEGTHCINTTKMFSRRDHRLRRTGAEVPRRWLKRYAEVDEPPQTPQAPSDPSSQPDYAYPRTRPSLRRSV